MGIDMHIRIPVEKWAQSTEPTTARSGLSRPQFLVSLPLGSLVIIMPTIQKQCKVQTVQWREVQG